MALTAHSLGRAVEEGLTYRFHASWSSVLQLLCVFFEACGRQAHPVMRKVTGVAAGPGQEVAGAARGARVSVTSALYSPTARVHCRCPVLCPQEGDWANVGGTRRGLKPPLPPTA